MKASLITFSTGEVNQLSRVLALWRLFRTDACGLRKCCRRQTREFLSWERRPWQSYSQSHDPAVRTGDGRAADDHARRWDFRMAHCRRFESRHPSRRVALAILGTGVQAHSHVEAMRCVRDFGEIHVWSRTPKKNTAFTQKHGCVAISAGNLAHGADVVVTATSSQEPVLKGEWL